ncbi:MAG: MraY family glycosyltransferase [Candidatus Zixiibacteriota bacterium]
MNWLALLIALGLSLVVAASLMTPAIRLADRHGFVDRPGRHKRHHRPVPNVGGVVLFFSLWPAVATCSFLSPALLAGTKSSLLYVFSGALVVFLVGLADDLKPLSAWSKLAAQTAAGLILYLGGLAINPVTIPFAGSYDIGSMSVIITIIWVVMLTNAINLIDGLDGLAAGVSLIACVTLVTIGTLHYAESAVLFANALIGFLAVFLFFNRFPAKIFLGDCGSLQIGYYFAVVSLLVPIKSYTAAALYLPLLALGVPLMETAISFSRRLVSGRNVMKADRRHLFHYLALAGLSPQMVVGIFYVVSAVFGGFALAMYFLNRLIVFGLLVLFMVVISGLFFIFMARMNRSPRNR